MKILKINNKDVVIKFNISTIKRLTKEGLNIDMMNDSLQTMDIEPVSRFFYHGVSTLRTDLSIDDTDKIMDDYFEEGGEFEEFIMIILEEYLGAMGLKLDEEEIEKEKQKILQSTQQ